MNTDGVRQRVVRPYDEGESPQSVNERQHQQNAPELGTADDDVYAKMRAANLPHVARPSRPAATPTLLEVLVRHQDYIAPLVYTILSYRQVDFVVWDEAHFGKFGSHYLKREFYFDVHPPLGKMLVGLVGAIVGYSGNFEFKSGEKYPEEVPYVAMRLMLSVFGVMMVPLAWLTAREMGMGLRAAHIVTLMTLCDVGWLAISRFILLDSMLLFFTFTTVFTFTKFHSERHNSFGADWWAWLTLTGLSIGCVCSVKWIGAFATAIVGLYTIEDLWNKFGDLKMPIRTYMYHWLARIACLILLPLVIYATTFKVHFMILNHSGPGDAQMPSLFQANLIGNDFGQNPLRPAFGSKITLKNMGFGGGLLHSHVQLFPEGSKQQQVTCYHYKDDNNHFNVIPPWGHAAVDPNGPINFLQDGSIIRLQHVSTKRNLHSHKIPAPVTASANEVSCYGNETIGDAGDHWQVEVVDDINQGSKKNVKEIHSLATRLRFKHVLLGCYLRAANVNLPQWGFKQIEVTCGQDSSLSDTHSYWNVENHWNDRLPMAEAKAFRSPFLRDFWHLNIAMMTSNNALVPDPDKEDILASKPLDWPFLYLGLRMCGWGDNQVKYYLLGNPVVWWGSSIGLGLALVGLLYYAMRWQRQYVDFESAEEAEKFLFIHKLSIIGWALHYLPFMVMGRVTYLHHYLPALYFAVLMFGGLLDHYIFNSRWIYLNARAKWTVFTLISFGIIDTFWLFSGLAFGIEGPISEHSGLGWRKSWNIY
ncbi:glycosyltransferase family 39 protein [Auriculariales sp. MPI-PUGE-AT-0066]|nr:glycosyltransferase family 39 protein [Auriculariales sp. MPI-PUGE-AT-0066]